MNAWKRFRRIARRPCWGWRSREYWRDLALIPWRLLRSWWRGYDDLEIWNLDLTLARFLSERMLILADRSASYPPQYASFEAWQSEMRTHAKALSDYDELGLCPEDDDAESMAAWAGVNERADEAMQWVAKWWRHLWS